MSNTPISERKMNEIIFLKEGTAPAPSKDFYHLSINKNKMLTLRSWNINLRVGTNRSPSQSIFSFHEFLEAKSLQAEIDRVFGSETLDHVKVVLSSSARVSLGDLPDNVTRRICLELDLSTIGRLAQTNKRLRSICYSDEIWCNLYSKNNGYVASEIKDVAKIIGWRTIFTSSTLHFRRFNSRLEDTKFAG